MTTSATKRPAASANAGTETGEPAIERQLDLHVEPGRVWRALTDPAEIPAWFGSATEFRAESGATGWFEWEGHARFELRVEAVEPGRYLAYRWLAMPTRRWRRGRRHSSSGGPIRPRPAARPFACARRASATREGSTTGPSAGSNR